MKITRPLSQTQLNMYLQCGEQYRRRYILGDKQPPGIAMVVGRGVDQSVTANLGARIETGALLPLEAVLDTARDAFEVDWIDVDPALEGERDAARAHDAAVDRVTRLARLHAESLAPTLAPTAVQREWHASLPHPTDPDRDVPLMGIVDVDERVAGEGGGGYIDLVRIRDTKTAGRRKGPGEADASLQLTMYAWEAELRGEVPELTLDFLVDTGEHTLPALDVQTSHRDPDQLRAFEARVGAVVQGIEAEIFLPATLNKAAWWCSERFCGYYRSCRYIRNPHSVAVAAPSPIPQSLVTIGERAPRVPASPPAFSPPPRVRGPFDPI